MIYLNPGVQIYWVVAPCDMRKSIDGLSVLLAEALNTAPQSGDVYLFRNVACDKVKLLYWDKNGFVLHYKRLEKGRFKFPRHTVERLELTLDQLSWLLAGLDFMGMQEFSHLNFTNYF